MKQVKLLRLSLLILQSMLDINNKELLKVNQAIQESDVYEDLSQLIKLFKQILLATQSIINRLQDDQSYEQLLISLKETLLLKCKLVQHYTFQLQEHSSLKNTYQRFFCRLIQHTTGYKMRNQNQHNLSYFLVQFIDRVQNCIYFQRQYHNIGTIFRKIFNYAFQFCNCCQIIKNNGSQKQILNEFKQTDSQQLSRISPVQQLKKFKDFVPQYQSNYQKVLNMVNNRFKTLNCLDLDYSSFKGDYLRCLSSKNDYYCEYYQRNQTSQRSIHGYSKQFKNYCMKKEKNRILRKNRLEEERQRLAKYQTLSSQNGSSRAISFKKTIKHKNSFLIKQQQNPSQLESINKDQWLRKHSDQQGISKFLQINFKSLADVKRKTTYQMKNIYLSLNKISDHKGRFQKNKNKQQKSFKINNKKKFNKISNGYYLGQKSLCVQKANQLKTIGMNIEGNLLRNNRISDTIKGNFKNVSSSKKSFVDKKNNIILGSLKRTSLTQSLHSQDEIPRQYKFQISLFDVEQQNIVKQQFS